MFNALRPRNVYQVNKISEILLQALEILVILHLIEIDFLTKYLVENAVNSISESLDFTIFWGSMAPRHHPPRRSSRLRRSLHCSYWRGGELATRVIIDFGNSCEIVTKTENSSWWKAVHRMRSVSPWLSCPSFIQRGKVGNGQEMPEFKSKTTS